MPDLGRDDRSVALPRSTDSDVWGASLTKRAMTDVHADLQRVKATC